MLDTDNKPRHDKGGDRAMSLNAIEKLADLVNDNAWLVHLGRTLDTTFLLGVGDTDYLVRIHRGRVEAADKGPFVQARWTFALRGASEAWDTFWQPLPPPGFHDLNAMIKTRALALEGDQYPFFANLRYFKDLLALPRNAASQAGRGAATAGTR
jgi:hypothetical protein